MPDHDKKALTAEAADIFVRLAEDPANRDICAERDAYLARGAQYREIYAKVTRAWDSTGRPARPPHGLLPALVAVALVASALVLEAPARRFLLADFTTRYETQARILASGDHVTLDADTALADATDGADRKVDLLEGAVLFDVARDGRAFVVQAGALTVEVLGTRFETAIIPGAVTVGVREGRVRVTSENQSWTLGAGDRLIWSADGRAELTRIAPQDVALWTQDRFVADGLSFAQVADVIDRRLPGRVMLGTAALAASRVSGTINLADPDLALQALAATRDARIISIPVLGKIILP